VTPRRLALYAVLIAAAACFAIPLVIIVMTSFKSMDAIRGGSIFALPWHPTFAPWIKAWSSACTGLACSGVSVGFFNSVRIAVPAVILSVFLGALNGYALALWPFRGTQLVLTALMLGAFIPYQIILYPLVKITSTLGLYGTIPGIVLIHIVFGLPVMTLIFRNYYAGLPMELVRAARMDGAGFFRIFVSVMLPLSPNVLVVGLILQSTGVWNDYLLGLIFAGREHWPMTVQLTNIVGSTTGEQEYDVEMAAALLTALPPLLIYFLSGRYFVRGVTSGAVKG